MEERLSPAFSTSRVASHCHSKLVSGGIFETNCIGYPIDLVDETGVEPATSSLRTMRN